MPTSPFTTLDDIRQALRDLPGPDLVAAQAALDRDGQLTKPPGALGRLENLAIWYAGWRGTPTPAISSPQVVVFAGNHGVTAQGVSAFPPEVTVQMVANFEHGGAAINQLAEVAGAKMDVLPLALDTPTADFTQGPAMAEAECAEAVWAGWSAVDPTADLLVVGEMGIGNTTPAAAISAALWGGTGQDWAGRGTGLDEDGVAHKAGVIDRALEANPSRDPLEVLRCLGGRELAAMAGGILAARHARIPVVLDGFICTASAAVLERASAGALDHCVAGHVSAEAAHPALLDRLGKAPLLALGLRLGEGSGGALAMNILKAAVACHSGMATFAEAGVSDG
ncbi:MAG: nicotinate-nucleotide--dimethylbenzimidazole phosphoribosyltransferase [Pseudomonadota bacterium]